MITWRHNSCYEEISFDFLPDVSIEIPSGDINTPLYDEVEEYFQQPFEELDTYMNAGYEPQGLTNSMTRESLEERLNRIGSGVLEFRGDSEREGGTGVRVAQVEELEASTAVEEEGYGGREDDETDTITGSRRRNISNSHSKSLIHT